LFTQFISQFEQYPVLYLGTLFVFGSLIGSFLNVVIYRLPIMMQREWRNDCLEFLQQPNDVEDTRFSLSVPRSRCGDCGHQITALENIPIVSYLVLGGKCSACKTAISPQYPLVEFFTAIVSLVIGWHFGVSLQAMAALVLTWSLIGYMSLWSVFMLFKLITGKEGMGYGDFKLLAMLGAWLGWKPLLVVILTSSLVGAIVGITMIVLRKTERGTQIPFGPYLAAAGWMTLLWGDELMASYASLFQF